MRSKQPQIMKTSKLILAGIAGVAMLASCGGNTEVKEETTEVKEMKHDGTFMIDDENSTVMWKGTMMGMYSHEGTVPFKSGNLVFAEGKITGGEFVVDLTSIQPTDDKYSEEKTKEMLVGHLSSPDFFDVANHPTAKFVVKSGTENSLTGDLTIRGKTHEETFNITEHNAEAHQMKGTLTFDRTKYDVNFKHPMQEMVLSNDIELNITLAAEMKDEEMHADND